jgi:foldase protein PrsA
VRIGDYAISLPEARRLVSEQARSSGEQPPDPPGYRRCAQRLQAASADHAVRTASQYKAECESQDVKLHEAALTSRIDDIWLISEAAALGIGVSEGMAEHRLNEIRAKIYPAKAAFDTFLRTTHETVPNLVLATRAELSEAALLKKVVTKPSHSAAARTAYYRAHEAEYNIPERRNVRVFRTHTRALALQGMSEVRAGKSFLSVAKHISIDPIHSPADVLAPSVERRQEDGPLGDAVFNAKVGALTGPIALHNHYYVFIVLKVIPALHPTRQEVEAEKGEEIEKAMRAELTATFIRGWRSRWKARTACRPGYVISKCWQYNGPAPKGDAYTF